MRGKINVSTRGMLEAHLKMIFHEIQWDTVYGLQIEQVGTKDHLVEAFMDIEKWIIHVKFNDGLPAAFATMISGNRVMDAIEPGHLMPVDAPDIDALEKEFPQGKNFHVLLHDYLASIAYHEFGHSKECPVDMTSFASIMQAVTTALEEKKRFNMNALGYIVNMFSDIVINGIYGLQARHAFFRNGFLLFHLAELVVAKELDVAFCHFVLVNTKLYQHHPRVRSLLEEHAAKDLATGYADTIKKLVDVFCPDDVIAGKLIAGIAPGEQECWKVIGFLSDKDRWPAMAYAFALVMIDMVKDNTPPENAPVPDSYYVKKFLEDDRFKAQVLDKIIEAKMKELVEGSGAGKPGKKAAGGAKKKGAAGSHAQGRYPGENDVDVGLQAFDTTAIYDSIYRHRIKQLRVSIEDGTKKDQVPVSWMSRDIMTDKDNPLAIDPMMVFFLPGSNDMLLYKKSLPIVEAQAGSVTHEGFPDLAVIYDDSGSMSWHPLDASGKYDAVIITIYSLLDWLKRINFAAAIEYNFTCFSSTTRTTGWIDYFHLDEVFQLLFDKQGGGTKLDIDVLKEILETPRNKVVLIITDGEIENAMEIKKILRSHKATTQFAFIQLGKMSVLANQLQDAGFHVVKLDDVNKLSEIALKFVSMAYESDA